MPGNISDTRHASSITGSFSVEALICPVGWFGHLPWPPQMDRNPKGVMGRAQHAHTPFGVKVGPFLMMEVAIVNCDVEDSWSTFLPCSVLLKIDRIRGLDGARKSPLY